MGLTPPALQAFTAPLVACGTHFSRLCALLHCHQISVTSSQDYGTVYECYLNGVKDLLMGYRSVVLHVLSCQTLFEVDDLMRYPVLQMRFVNQI